MGSSRHRAHSDRRTLRARQGAGSESGYGAPSGTWDYASPEQRLGFHVDHRTDVFSLGATLYHLATGTSPGLRIVADRIPQELREVILTATEEEPQNRFYTMEEMLRALTTEQPQTKPPKPSPEPEPEAETAPAPRFGLQSHFLNCFG